MIFSRKIFLALLLATAAGNNSAYGHQGGIRGVATTERNDITETVLHEETNHRRNLKEEKNGGGGGGGSTPFVPTPPVTPPMPQPVGPTPLQEFQTGCNVFFTDNCNRCLYGYTTVSSGSASLCRSVCGNILGETLNTKVECGRNGNAPLPVSVPDPLPAPVPEFPVPDPVVPVPMPGGGGTVPGDPDPSVGPGTGPPPGCSDKLAAGDGCSVLDDTCCVDDSTFCVCGSDFRYVCNSGNVCTGSAIPIIQPPLSDAPVIQPIAPNPVDPNFGVDPPANPGFPVVPDPGDPPANPGFPVVPDPGMGPGTGPSPNCSGLKSGDQCFTMDDTCCKDGSTLCTCGSDLRYLCNSEDVCTDSVFPIIQPSPSEVPVIQPIDPIPVDPDFGVDPEGPVVLPNPVPIAPAPTGGPVPSGGGIPLPANIDFSGISAWCPSTILQCSPCAQDLPAGQFEGSCSAATVLSVPGVGDNIPVDVQCRCYTQDNPNPVWTCRYISGAQAGTPIAPVAPSCANGNEYDGPDDIGFGPPPDVAGPFPSGPDDIGFGPPPDVAGPFPSEDEPPSSDGPGFISGVVPGDPLPAPVIISPTTIPPAKTCPPRLPTTGFSVCAVPSENVCCYNVQPGLAKVCNCVDGLFQCRTSCNWDCPCDQNPECIVPINPFTGEKGTPPTKDCPV